MLTRTSACGLVSLAIIGLAACSSDPVDGIVPPALEVPSAPFAFPGYLSEPTEITDDQGRTWLGKPVTSFAKPSIPGEVATAPKFSPGLTDAERDKLSDEEYLERMKPLKIAFDDSGHAVEYTLKEWGATTREVILGGRRKQRAGVIMRSFGPGRVQEFSGETIPPAPAGWAEAYAAQQRPDFGLNQSVSPQGVIPHPGCGGVNPCDQRVWLTHSQTFLWPNLAQVHFRPTTSFGLAGSGTMVGRFTAFSCAHIFHQPWNAATGLPGAWYDASSWRVALTHSTLSGSHKYKSGYPYQPTESATFPGLIGGYHVDIPTSFINGNSEGDFALVQFTGGVQPGATTGYLAPAYGVNSDYATAPIQMQSYDGDPPYPPSQPPGSHVYSFPSMIHRNMGAGAGAIHPTYSFVLMHLMDTTPGSSGGGMEMNLFLSRGDSSLYYVGDNHSGDNTLNYGRRLDAGLWAWLQGLSAEY